MIVIVDLVDTGRFLASVEQASRGVSCWRTASQSCMGPSIELVCIELYTFVVTSRPGQ